MHQRLRHRAHGQEGFTLIELLVVILIIGILAAVAIPTFLSQTGKAKDSNVQSNLNTIQTAEATYNTSAGNYTASLTNLGNTEGTIKSFSTTNYAVASSGSSTSTPNNTTMSISDPSGGTNIAWIAAGSSGTLASTTNLTPSTSAVTYYIVTYSDGGVANVCYVPTSVNAGACNTSSGGSGAGTWGNGNT